MTPDLRYAFDIAAGQDGAVGVFAYARTGLAESVGSLLTTATVYDMPSMMARRVWTDDDAAYPTGNFKRIERNRYFETVLDGKAPFSATTIEDIATVFFDFEKIEALGFESVMNLPAVAGDEVIGTVNMLHRKGHYTPERVAAAMAWQPVLTLAFLLLRNQSSGAADFHGYAEPHDNGVIEG